MCLEANSTVRFASTVHTSVGTIPEYTDTDRCGLWYQYDELQKFKTNARNASQMLRLRKRTFPGQVLEDLDFSHGLEHRVCFERQKRKYLAIKSVIASQMILKNRDGCDGYDTSLQLALISSKLTNWAKEIALKEAKQIELSVGNATNEKYCDTPLRMPSCNEAVPSNGYQYSFKRPSTVSNPTANVDGLQQKKDA